MLNHTSTPDLAANGATDAATRPLWLAATGPLRRTALAALFVIAAACPASAQPGAVDGAAILNAGVYELDLGRKIAGRNRSGLAHHIVTAKRLNRSTTDIPARLCLSFGFEYVILGAPTDAAVPIRMITRFPSPGLRDPETKAVAHRDEIVINRVIGKVHFRSFTLEHPSDLVPGLWTFELWYNDRKLAEQGFTLTVPCADCAPHEPQPMSCVRQTAAVTGHSPRCDAI